MSTSLKYPKLTEAHLASLQAKHTMLRQKLDDSRRGNYLPSKKDLAAMATKPKTKSTPKSLPKCQCGCGHHTKGGRFIPGHDAKLKSKIIALAESGKVAQAKKIAADQGWSGLNLADRAKK